MQQSHELTDVVMSLDELVNACGQQRQWILALLEENIIEYDAPTQQFSGYQLAIARRAARISRDFDASVPAVGLILSLLDELEELRQLKRQWQADNQHHSIIEVQAR